MIPLEWVVFLITFAASLVKLLKEGVGKEFKVGIVFIILTIIVAAILGIFFGFIDAFLSQTTYTIDQTTIITYLFDAFIGAIIIPLVQYLTTIKLE